MPYLRSTAGPGDRSLPGPARYLEPYELELIERLLGPNRSIIFLDYSRQRSTRAWAKQIWLTAVATMSPMSSKPEEGGYAIGVQPDPHIIRTGGQIEYKRRPPKLKAGKGPKNR